MRHVILAFDPSGNYYEGKGTTGWCLANDGYVFAAGQIYAAEYRSQMEYWTAVVNKIKTEKDKLNPDDKFEVVCEDYRLYASESNAQINSNLETPQLIGVIKWCCNLLNIPLALQMAAEVKNRWSNEVLERKGLIHKEAYNSCYYMGSIKIEHHAMDAVRHCLHYMTFKAMIRTDNKPARHQIVHKKDWADYEEENIHGFRSRKEIQYGKRV